MDAMSVAYEELLSRRWDWALREGSLHLDGRSGAHQAMHDVTRRLGEQLHPFVRTKYGELWASLEADAGPTQ